MDKLLKFCLIDILKGHSICEFLGRKAYIKHLTILDSGEIDFKKEEFREKGLKSGLFSEKEKNDIIIKDKLWSKDKDNEIEELKVYIDNLKQSKRKLLKSQEIQELVDLIDININKLDILIKEKKELIGLTAEEYSNRRINEYYIFISMFEDENLKKHFFSALDFEDLDNEQLYALIEIYNNIMSKFNEKNLKKISLSSDYLNLFNLSEGSMNLYGKPSVNLTFYQIELMSYAKYFKDMLSNAKTPPPKESFADPDKLIEWIESGKNIEEILSKNKSKKNNDLVGSSIVGGSKEDIEKIKTAPNTFSLDKEAEKKGGILTMQDLIKLHGL